MKVKMKKLSPEESAQYVRILRACEKENRMLSSGDRRIVLAALNKDGVVKFAAPPQARVPDLLERGWQKVSCRPARRPRRRNLRLIK